MEYTPSPYIRGNCKRIRLCGCGARLACRTMAAHSPHSDQERHALKLRLRRVAGQLKGIEGMLDRECDCAEILNQLVSARRALKSFSEKIIHDHLHHCIKEAAREDEARRSLRELIEVLERYIE